MNNIDFSYSLDNLVKLTGTSRRSIRYYIQEGLLEPPQGRTKSAKYDQEHLERLLSIRRLSRDGYSLELIKHHFAKEDRPAVIAPVRRGSINVMTHLHIADGITLILDCDRANLTGNQVQQLAKQIAELYSQTQPELNQGENQ